MEQTSSVNLSIYSKVYSLVKNRRSICFLCLNHTCNRALICQNCEQDLPYNRLKCSICAKPLIKTGICGDCVNNKRTAIDKIDAAFSYQYPIDRLLQATKFREDFIAGALLAEIAAKQLLETFHDNKKPDLLLPVPLHPGRLFNRGFNQSQQLASAFSKSMNVPCSVAACTRIKPTVAQSSLGAKQRKQNVLGAFATNQLFTNQYVVIVDDVITTGSTVKELAKQIKKAGASRVDVWACAIRAPL